MVPIVPVLQNIDIFSKDGTFMGKAKISLSIENEGFNAEVKKRT
ncbi:MAG TPA: hypothetical protein VFG01_03520 [Acidobacteriota bacterium]|nr:hypothetical protein [Acidobacteriota bacterium]